MIFDYCRKAMEKAEHHEIDDGRWFSKIPGLKGVWANPGTEEDCRWDRITVLEEWIIRTLRDGDIVPEIHGLSIWETRVVVQ